MSADTLATLIATAVALGWILLMVCAAVLIGHLFAGPPEVMLADNFAEHEDEVLEVDGPTSRPYVAQGGPIPGGLWAAERDERELVVALPQCKSTNDDGLRCKLAAGHPPLPVIPWRGLNITADGHIWEDAPLPRYCRACVVAYSEHDHAAICTDCAPRMGVRP